MSSKEFVKHYIGTNTLQPINVGDERYDTSTNKLYKTIVLNGTTLTQSEIAFNSSTFNFDSLKATTAAVTGAVTANSISVTSRIGFANTTSSIVYQTYNPATQTIDTIFG